MSGPCLWNVSCLVSMDDRNSCRHTQCFVFLQRLVVASPSFRPLRELVLRAGIVHLALLFKHRSLQLLLFARGA